MLCLETRPRLASRSWSSCPSLPSSGIAGAHQCGLAHGCFKPLKLRIHKLVYYTVLVKSCLWVGIPLICIVIRLICLVLCTSYSIIAVNS